VSGHPGEGSPGGGFRERPPVPEPLPRPVTDNHCHLDVARGGGAFGGGSAGTWLPTEEALALARSVNVTRVVQIGCNLESARWAVATATERAEVVAGVALHPNDAALLGARGEFAAAYAEIERLAASPMVRAVGETGLDYFRTAEDGRPAQHESFRRHIALATRLAKTLVIHDRDAHDDTLRILDEEGAPERWVMHCFSGDADFARRCLDRGAYLSFAGTVTFGNAEDLREALKVAPSDRILVETDAPYLTPAPYRGQPNASYLIPHIVRAIAEIRGANVEALCDSIQAATETAYGGGW
jgi:TatD DNase family protein